MPKITKISVMSARDVCLNITRINSTNPAILSLTDKQFKQDAKNLADFIGAASSIIFIETLVKELKGFVF